jgi:drug/metabolite transporter (DMT)-like permease
MNVHTGDIMSSKATTMNPRQAADGTTVTAITRTTGVALAIASAALSAVQYPLNKIALTYGLSTSSAALLETFFTIVFCLLAYALRLRKPVIIFDRHMMLIGTLNAAAVILLFNALQSLPPAVVGFWGRLYFAFASLASVVILKEKPRGVDLAASVLLLVGLLAFSHGGATLPTGTLLLMAVAYPAIFAIQNALIKKHIHNHDPSSIVLSQKLCCLVLLLTYFLVSGSAITTPSLEGIGLVAVATLFSSFFSLWALYYALSKIDFMTANLMRGTGPLFVIAISAPFFPVSIDFVGWLGVAIITASTILPTLINISKHPKIIKERTND